MISIFVWHFFDRFYVCMHPAGKNVSGPWHALACSTVVHFHMRVHQYEGRRHACSVHACAPLCCGLACFYMYVY